MIQLKVKSLEVVEGSPLVRVTLQESEGERELHIWIGWPEASAIQSHLEGSHPLRPMTHDLMASLLAGLQAKVQQLLISEMKEDTFFAEIILQVGETSLRLTAAPQTASPLPCGPKPPFSSGKNYSPGFSKCGSRSLLLPARELSWSNETIPLSTN